MICAGAQTPPKTIMTFSNYGTQTSGENGATAGNGLKSYDLALRARIEQSAGAPIIRYFGGQIKQMFKTWKGKTMKKMLGSLAVVLLLMGVAAAQDASTVSQLGTNQKATVTQTGGNQISGVTQSNASNVASVTQSYGGSQVPSISQSALVNQNGTSNNASISQTDNAHTAGSNSSSIQQTGSQNNSQQFVNVGGEDGWDNQTGIQTGSKNQLYQNSYSPASATTLSGTQEGTSNKATQNMASTFSTGSIEQVGNSNVATQGITGRGINDATAVQTGSNNLSSQSLTVTSGNLDYRNNATVTQSGNSNQAYQTINGYQNTASASQGNNNISRQTQSANVGFNVSNVSQGSNNVASVNQTGSGNGKSDPSTANITQVSNDNAAIGQSGFRQEASIRQQSYDVSTISQQGSWNGATIYLDGNSGYSTISQNGSQNDAYIENRHSGSNNDGTASDPISIVQNGNLNYGWISTGDATVSSGNKASIQQLGNANNSNISQEGGNLNIARSYQTSDGNTGSITQLGSSNLAVVTQH